MARRGTLGENLRRLLESGGVMSLASKRWVDRRFDEEARPGSPRRMIWGGSGGTLDAFACQVTVSGTDVAVYKCRGRTANLDYVTHPDFTGPPEVDTITLAYSSGKWVYVDFDVDQSWGSFTVGTPPVIDDEVTQNRWLIAYLHDALDGKVYQHHFGDLLVSSIGVGELPDVSGKTAGMCLVLGAGTPLVPAWDWLPMVNI